MPYKKGIAVTEKKKVVKKDDKKAKVPKCMVTVKCNECDETGTMWLDNGDKNKIYDVVCPSCIEFETNYDRLGPRIKNPDDWTCKCKLVE